MSRFPPIESVLILGAGRFGRIGLERLLRRHPDAKFRVVEAASDKLALLPQDGNVRTICADAVTWLCDNPPAHETWIVPAVPIHLTFEWLLTELERSGRHPRRIPVPPEVDARVPHPYRMGDTTLFASYADFICPDNCAEAEICRVTKQPRPGNLYETLAGVALPGFRTLVLRSHQLAPGVGGFPMASLVDLRDQITSNNNRYLVATACCCHGVLGTLELLEDASKPSFL